MAVVVVFISYSRVDAAFVERLRSDLRKSGATIWIDHESLPPGHPDWQAAIRRSVDAAAAVVYVGSPDAAKSVNVGSEVLIAQAKQRLIIPVWARGGHWTECAPFELMRANYLDARGEAYSAALASLCRALNLQGPTSRLRKLRGEGSADRERSARAVGWTADYRRATSNQRRQSASRGRLVAQLRAPADRERRYYRAPLGCPDGPPSGDHRGPYRLDLVRILGPRQSAVRHRQRRPEHPRLGNPDLTASQGCVMRGIEAMRGAP